MIENSCMNCVHQDGDFCLLKFNRAPNHACHLFEPSDVAVATARAILEKNETAAHPGTDESDVVFGSDPYTDGIVKDVLEKAGAAIRDRSVKRGALASFGEIAALWSAYTGTEINCTDVAHMMILLKVARAKTSPKVEADNFTDMAGYAAIAAALDSERRGACNPD